MEKSCYQEIISEVSNKLAKKILSEEKDLAQQAIFLDKDIAEFVREIGLQTVQKVLENTRDEIVVKKKLRV
jgi:hypothetical protein